jgi:hypothetical protein
MDTVCTRIEGAALPKRVVCSDFVATPAMIPDRAHDGKLASFGEAPDPFILTFVRGPMGRRNAGNVTAAINSIRNRRRWDLRAVK